MMHIKAEVAATGDAAIDIEPGVTPGHVRISIDGRARVVPAADLIEAVRRVCPRPSKPAPARPITEQGIALLGKAAQCP